MLGLAGAELGGPGMEQGMTWDEVATKLGRDLKELQEEVVGEQEVEPIEGRLRIWSRARHVVSFFLLQVLIAPPRLKMGANCCC